MPLAPQGEGVPAPGKEVNLCRDARGGESPRVDGAVADVVDGRRPTPAKGTSAASVW
jgi:hypothetical protein